VTERRAEDASRDVVYRLKCEFLADREGEVFAGVVSGVTAFGLFVTLNEAQVSGLVHVSGLGSDYFHFVPAVQQLHGEHSGRVFKLGDTLRVRIHSVSPEERKIDLELVDVVRRQYGPGGSKVVRTSTRRRSKPFGAPRR